MIPAKPIQFANWSPDMPAYNNPGCEVAENCLPYLAAPNYTNSLSLALSNIGPPNGGTYATNAVKYDGATNFLSLDTNLSGITNGQVGTLSFWVRLDVTQKGWIVNIQEAATPFTQYFSVQYDAGVTDNFEIFGYNSAGTKILDIKTTNGYTAGNKWLNILASWNLATGAATIWVNDVEDVTIVTATNDTLAYAKSGNGIYIGASSIGGATFSIGANLFPSYPNAQFTVAGVNPSGYNGTFTSQNPTNHSVGAVIASNPGSYVSGGTVTSSQLGTFNLYAPGANPGASYSNGVVTFNIASNSITIGQSFTVSGVTPACYNGTYTCTGISQNSQGQWQVTANTSFPLTLYMTDTASSTLSTANELSATAGGSDTDTVTSVTGGGSSTSLYSQGGTAASRNSSPLPATGKGFLFDSTAYEGLTIPAQQISLKISAAAEFGGTPSLSTTVSGVVYKRSSAGVYTLIANCQSVTTQLTTSKVTFTVTGTATQTTFATGDKLYVEVGLQCNSVADYAPFLLYQNGGTNAGESITLQIGYGTWASGGVITPTYVYNVTNATYGDTPKNLFDGCLAEMWFNTTFMDFTVAANRALFISGGYPVNLGSNGQTPTGSSPLLYLKSAANSVGTNSGTGGNFTTNGTFAIASSAPSTVVTLGQYLGAFAATDTTDTTHIYAGAQSYITEITSSSANNVSVAGGYNCGAYWKFVQFQGNVYATDLNDPIQVMAVGGTAFANLASGAPKAQQIGTIGQFIIVGNTNGGTIGGSLQGAVPNRVMWCAINTPTSWPDPLTNAGIAAQAGYEDLNPSYGQVQGVTYGTYYGLIFQENAIYNVQYVGGNVVFQFNDFEKQRGAWAPNAIMQIGDQVYFLHSSGFFMTNGLFTEPIGHDLIDETFLADVNTAYINNIRASHDVANKCIWWSYVSQAATPVGGFIISDKVIVYNYLDKRWAMGLVGQSIDMIFSNRTLPYTMEELDAFGNLDVLMPSLDSPYWNGGQPQVGAFGIAQISESASYGSYLGTFSGTPLPATLQTTEVSLNPGGRSFISEVKPIVIGATLADIALAPVTRTTLSAEPVVGSFSVPNTRTGKCQVRSDDVFHRFEVQITGGFLNATGVEVEARPSGFA